MELTGGFFGEIVEAGFHETAIRLVTEGEIDASAIDSQVLEVEQRDHPELAAQLRVVETLGPSTIQPVAVSRRIDSVLRADPGRARLAAPGPWDHASFRIPDTDLATAVSVLDQVRARAHDERTHLQ